MEWILEPWPWYVAGIGIAVVMVVLMLFEKSFGVSSNLRSICSILGAGYCSDFFKFNWRAQVWNLTFIVGSIIGGFIAHQYLTTDHSIDLNPKTQAALVEKGIENPGSTFLPDEIFGTESAFTAKGFLFLLIGGVLVGFGTRYAGGCTSGHAITGLSNLQLPSLIAVIGFFIGGLVMTHFILPFII
ncbi:MAG: YeeE/YedE family protein [Bacteroidetes bacterium]|nr:YeeE/YedE family protein [Bacteroidota bacterium]